MLLLLVFRGSIFICQYSEVAAIAMRNNSHSAHQQILDSVGIKVLHELFKYGQFIQ